MEKRVTEDGARASEEEKELLELEEKVNERKKTVAKRKDAL